MEPYQSWPCFSTLLSWKVRMFHNGENGSCNLQEIQHKFVNFTSTQKKGEFAVYGNASA